MARQLVTADEATPALRQHTKPCSDCPWSRNALNGWLGSLSPEQWINEARSETLIDCHVHAGAQCAGAAIFRANICKSPRYPNILRLPSDRRAVFAGHQEFLDHHGKKRMSDHEALKDAARNAVQALHGDTSVSQAQTRESLEEIRDEINDMLESLPDDED